MDKLCKKKILSKIVLPLLIVAMLFSAAAFLFAPKHRTDVFAASLETLNFENNEFENSSGSFPVTPTGWTKSTGTNVTEGATVSGILDPATFNTTDNKNASKLGQYAEFAAPDALPQTPFGKSISGLSGGAKFLMINTTSSSRTAVKYTSSEVTLSANKFYEISAWVRTGDFAEGTGASIRLNGLDGNYAFNKINTVAKRANIGDTDLQSPNHNGTELYWWRQYTFYVATSPLGSKTVSVALGVGDEYESEDADKSEVNYASGFAFFDMVAGRELDATEFNEKCANIETFSESASQYYQIVDLSLESAMTADDKENFSFGKQRNWTPVGYDATYVKESFIADYPSDNGLPQFGIDEAPSTSVGKLPAYEDNGFVESRKQMQSMYAVSSFDKKDENDTNQYNRIHRGITSVNRLTVPMFSYYRLGFWVKTDGVESTSGADAVLTTDKPVSGTSGSETEFTEFTIENMTGDADNAGRHGWKEYAFYIQGSSVQDYTFDLTFRLGDETSPAQGTVLFGNISFDKISSSEFSANSANGTIVAIDGTFSDNDKGVTNGAFYLAGDYDKYVYPLAPASWTKISASDAGWTGYSSDSSHADYENVLSGIVPTGIPYTGEMFADFGRYGIENPRPNEKGNLLVISSEKPTALGYRSSDITVTANTAYRLNVSLKADAESGYGANLVLKSGDKVISTIENIKKSDRFETYTFYINGAPADRTVTVELWLGMLDRDKNNNSKLSSGTVYFQSVSFEALADGESFATFKTAYEEDLRRGIPLRAAAYNFAAEDFTAYDNYSEGAVKYPYNWALSGLGNADVSGVVYGIFDSKNIPGGTYEIPESFRNSPDAANNGVLYLHNVSPTASKLTLDGGYTVAASTYYKLSVTLKVDLSAGNADTAIGAGVELNGTGFKFSNISNTNTITDEITDKETFKTFDFYILGGASEQTVSIAITLGSGEYENRYCAGRVYVNDITFTEIDNVQFDEAVEKFDDPETKEFSVGATQKNTAYGIKVDFSASSDDTDDGDDSTDGAKKSSFNWWLVPSILFSAALLIAIVGIVVRRITEKKSKKPKTEKVSGYDRKHTLNSIHNNNSDGKNKVKGATPKDETYSGFDDDVAETPEEKEEKTEKSEAEPAEEQTEENKEQAEAQIEQAETEKTEESSEADSAPEPSEEKAAKSAEEKPEEEKTAKTVPDPYTDEFDD